MLMFVLCALAVVTLLAAAAEALTSFSDSLFSVFCREQGLQEDLVALRKDIEKSRKKLDGVMSSLPAVRQELARAKGALGDLEKELQLRQKTPELFVFSLLTDDGRGTGRKLFRAIVTKQLAEPAETGQTAIWSRTCVIELMARNATEAMADARRQFPASQGYAIGSFVEKAAAPAAPVQEVAA
jgi:hypothetical protein